MSIQLSWDKTTITPAIHMTFEPGWTLEAYYHSIAALDAMLRAAHHPAAVIMDMSQASPGYSARRLPRGRHINEDRVLCKAATLILIQPGHFMPRVTCPVNLATSLEDAYSQLGEQAEPRLTG